jgi:hypothetical protein
MPDGMMGLMGGAPQGAPPQQGAPQQPNPQMLQQLAQGIIQRIGPQGAMMLVQMMMQMLKQ